MEILSPQQLKHTCSLGTSAAACADSNLGGDNPSSLRSIPARSCSAAQHNPEHKVCGKLRN